MSTGVASVGALVSQGAGKITLTGRLWGASSVLGAVGGGRIGHSGDCHHHQRDRHCQIRIDFINCLPLRRDNVLSGRWFGSVGEREKKSGTSGNWLCSLHAHTEGLFMRRKR